MSRNTVSGVKIRVKKMIFMSEETGFGVFKVSGLPEKNADIIVGSLFDVREGDTLEVDGEFAFHPRFGSQFRVSGFRSLLPEDKDGIIKFLSSGRIKGIGKKSAEKIADKFGTDTFEIIEKYPERLKEVKGLRKDIIKELSSSFNESRALRELIVKLSPFGIGNETAFKIYREFGDEAAEILGVNPYKMIERIRGVGFRRADLVARGFGIPFDDPYRVMSGIKYVLALNEERKGDLYMTVNGLKDEAKRLLGVGEEKIFEGIKDLRERNEVVTESIPEEIIILFNNFLVEKAISRYLRNLALNFPAEAETDISRIKNGAGVELTDEQKNAVLSAVNNKITIITGGPGTGKTTIIRAIIEAFEESEGTVLIAAPTGRAAKRIEEATSCQTSTIHRMLKISPETRRFVHDESNPLKADAVIIDEFSMVDSNLFFSLLKALPVTSKLIIIGDKDQLPSVGPGNVLRDIIASGYFNTIYLSRNFRQSEDSLIIDNAYRINQGEEPLIHKYSGELDFVFVNFTDAAMIPDKVLRIIEYHNADFNFNAMSCQVLSPVYRGDSGIDRLNTLIQEKFNPAEMIFTSERLKLKTGDKVMQLKNNYEKEIFNGEHGIVTGYDVKTGILTVDFDGILTHYTPDEFEEITLSYAISIHKSQGSEYDYLILALSPAHAAMLNRELLYTAVTRARKKIFIVSDMETIRKAVARSAPGERRTLLCRRLKENFEMQ